MLELLMELGAECSGIELHHWCTQCFDGSGSIGSFLRLESIIGGVYDPEYVPPLLESAFCTLLTKFAARFLQVHVGDDESILCL